MDLDAVSVINSRATAEYASSEARIAVLRFNFSISPNPFNEKTVISFEMQVASWVELAIYDITGRGVQSLVSGHWSLGKHSVVWDAKGMPSGVYFVRLKAGDFSQVQKMVLMK
jgi:hypothetical protein